MRVALKLIQAAEGNSGAMMLYGLPGGTQPELPITKPLVTIGSSQNANIALYDPGLSAMHLVLGVLGNRVFFTNLDFQTGTKVNNEFPLSGEGELKSGDEIQIGEHTIFRVLIEPDLEKQPAKPFPEPADFLSKPLTVCADDYSDWK